MNPDANTLIKQEFDKLPLDIKEAISRVDWQGKVREIATQEKLDEEKTLSLEVETMFILFGILMPEHYLGNIITEVGLDEDIAKRIEKEVGKQVFDEVEKQYEMITALMPKTPTATTSTSTPSVNDSKPLSSTVAPFAPTKTIEIPTNLPIPRPEELTTPVTSPSVEVPKTMLAPGISTSVSTRQPLASTTEALRARSLDDLNLLNKPTPDSKSATVEPSKSTSYPSGKDPYREPLE